MLSAERARAGGVEGTKVSSAAALFIGDCAIATLSNAPNGYSQLLRMEENLEGE